MRHIGCVANDKGGYKALRLIKMSDLELSSFGKQNQKEKAEKILAAGVDCVDLNIGCPARNVILLVLGLR